jgi:hypothetical protein
MRRSLVLLLALAACGDERPARDCVATVDDDVRTRLHVSWAAPAGRSWVELSAEGREPLVAPASDGEAHAAVLLGAGPLEDVAWTAITDDGDRRWTCSGVISTGNADAGLPPVELVAWEPDLASPERFVLGTLIGPDAWVFLMDREGRFVWWQRADPQQVVVDVEPVGGAEITWNAFSYDFSEQSSTLRTASVLGGAFTETHTPMGHHTFEVTPEGPAWLALDVRDWADPETGEVFRVGGDALVVGEDVLWSAWDTFDPKACSWPVAPFYADVIDWTHGNGLDWDPDRGVFVYSSWVLETVVEIDAASGAVVDTYGEYGAHGFADVAFREQHDPSFTSDGHLLVAGLDEATDTTRATEWAIAADGRLERVWDSGDADLKALFLGQATRLANGNTLVGYGSAGVVQEVTPDRRVAWEIRAGLGYGVGMVTLVTDPYDMLAE